MRPGRRDELGDQPPEVRELLERRASRLRAEPPAVDEEATLWVAEFPVGDERFAIPLDVLRGVVPLRNVTSVPLAPAHVVGVLRFEGQMIAALSMSSLLGGRGFRQDPAVLLVVEAAGQHLLALDCEQIPKPTALPVAPVEAARVASRGALLSVTTRDLRTVLLLDLGKLLAERRLGG